MSIFVHVFRDSNIDCINNILVSKNATIIDICETTDLIKYIKNCIYNKTKIHPDYQIFNFNTTDEIKINKYILLELNTYKPSDWTDRLVNRKPPNRIFYNKQNNSDKVEPFDIAIIDISNNKLIDINSIKTTKEETVFVNNIKINDNDLLCYFPQNTLFKIFKNNYSIKIKQFNMSNLTFNLYVSFDTTIKYILELCKMNDNLSKYLKNKELKLIYIDFSIEENDKKSYEKKLYEKKLYELDIFENFEVILIEKKN